MYSIQSFRNFPAEFHVRRICNLQLSQLTPSTYIARRSRLQFRSRHRNASSRYLPRHRMSPIGISTQLRIHDDTSRRHFCKSSCSRVFLFDDANRRRERPDGPIAARVVKSRADVPPPRGADENICYGNKFAGFCPFPFDGGSYRQRKQIYPCTHTRRARARSRGRAFISLGIPFSPSRRSANDLRCESAG